MSNLYRTLLRFFSPRAIEARSVLPRPEVGGPRTYTYTLSDIPAAGSDPLQVSDGGWSVMLAPASHAGANLEVAFGAKRPAADSQSGGWQPLTPGSVVRAIGGQQFEAFWLRKRTTVPSDLDDEELYVVVDPDAAEGAFEPRPRAPQLTALGSMAALFRALTLAGAEVALRASDEGALAIAGWNGAAYYRAFCDGAGRLKTVGTINNGNDLDQGYGATDAGTQRVTLANDDYLTVLSKNALQSLTGALSSVNTDRLLATLFASGAANGDYGEPTSQTLRVIEATPAANSGSSGAGQGQVTVAAATSTQIVSSNAARSSLLIRNDDSANDVWLSIDGTAAVKTTDFKLPAQGSITIRDPGQIVAIGDGTNAVVVHFMEESSA